MNKALILHYNISGQNDHSAGIYSKQMPLALNNYWLKQSKVDKIKEKVNNIIVVDSNGISKKVNVLHFDVQNNEVVLECNSAEEFNQIMEQICCVTTDYARSDWQNGFDKFVKFEFFMKGGEDG